MGQRAIAMLIWWCATTQALYINLPGSGTKCVSEHIQNNVLVLVEYVLVSFDPEAHLKPGVNVSATVKSPHGKTLYHNDKETYGEIPFTTTESGIYSTCFSIQENQYADNYTRVSVEWRVGVAATNWKAVARKENIEGVELEMRKLEGVVKAIFDHLVLLKNKEVKMREVSDETNEKVAQFSIMSLGVCIGASVLQVCYLRRFFRRNKLI